MCEGTIGWLAEAECRRLLTGVVQDIVLHCHCTVQIMWREIDFSHRSMKLSLLILFVKVKACSHIVQQVIEQHCSVNRRQGPAFSVGHSPCPHTHRLWILWLYAAPVCCIIVSTPVTHKLYYRPQRDGRLSCPSWLTHSGQFTYKVVTCQP